MEYAKKELYDPGQDPVYASPVILEDRIEQREVIGGESVPYHYVHGQFEGTAVKFLFCIPMREGYEGRFFQHISPFPGPDEELASLPKNGEDDFIAFALTHGAGFVETNMGSRAVFGAAEDPSIFYKSNAAAASYCRTYLQELYGPHRVYGYCFGGSGGGYKTMSCIENTVAYDGAVPFVIGSPVSLPNCLCVPAHGKRLLRHAWQKIVEALDAGGSGDPYQGLNEEEADALREITRMGFPPRMCIQFAGEDDGALPVLAPAVHEMDGAYFEDFWSVPGYLGAEQGSSAQRDRICLRTKIRAAGVAGGNGRTGAAAETAIDGRNGTDSAWQKMLQDGGAAYIEVEDVPEGTDLYLKGTELYFESGAAAGRKLALGRIEGHRLIPGMSFGADDIAQVIGLLRPGDEIRIDNSDYIAIQTYYRHQIPEDRSFYAWDQFRKADGTPALPQRPYVISYGFTAGGCGSVQDGKIQGHVIVMNSLMDGDFPWQADWYRRKVEEVYGERAQEIFRVWFNDNTPHGDVNDTDEPLRVVSYLGMLRQALLDVAHWTEDGTEPAPCSGYELTDSQITLTEDPRRRGGSQPMVTLLADGSESAEIEAGQSVTFTARVQLPETAGAFEAADFSFEGGAYEMCDCTVREQAATEQTAAQAEVTCRHRYAAPGTYYAVVRVISNRNPGDPYTRLRNLARARVIVK